MKSLTELEDEAVKLQTEIKTLLSDHYRFDEMGHEMFDKLSSVPGLQDELKVVQREIRERLAA